MVKDEQGRGKETVVVVGSHEYHQVVTPKGAGGKGLSSSSSSSSSLVSFTELFQFADRTDRVLIGMGILGGIMTGLLQPIQIIVFGDVLNAFNIRNEDMEEVQDAINTVTLRFVWVALAALVGGTAQVACFTIASNRQIRRIRMAYVQAILRQDISWFDLCEPMELASKVADATFTIEEGIGRKAGDGFNFFAMAVGGIVIGLIKGWQLALSLLAFTPVLAFTAYMMMKTLGNAVASGNDAYSRAGGIAEEALSNVRTIHSFNAGSSVVKNYAASLEGVEKAGIKKSISVGMGTGGMFLAVFCTYAFGMYYGAVLVSNDQLEGNICSGSDCYDGGRVLIVFFSVIMGAMALGQAGPSMQAVAAARGAAVEVFNIIQRKSAIDPESEKGEKLDVVSGHIKIENVNFAYPSRPNLPICKNFTLDIQAGETVALVGASGCGKSTIVSLLERYYDTQSGSIFLDGCDIKSLNVKFLRSQIGLVGQEPALFRTTIRENIALGKSGLGSASLEEVHEAARKANAYEFIMSMPDGFETQVGEKGTQLSGGQKQRIAIARAIIKNPKILLLDEATSALDTESERIVQQSLDQLLLQSQRTTIIIAHRLSTIRNVDRIALIHEGTVWELGPHEKLMKMTDGRYRALVQKAQDCGSSTMTMNEGIESDGKEMNKNSAVKDSVISPLVSGDETKVSKDRANEEEDKQQELYKVPMSRLWGLIGDMKLYIVMGAIGAALNGAVFPVWGLLLTKVTVLFFQIDFTVEEMRSEASQWSIGFALLGVLFSVALAMQNYGFAVVTERMTKRLRCLALEAFLKQEIGWFDQKEHSSGALTTRLATDTATIQALTLEVLNRNVVTLFSLGVAFGIAFYYSWEMTLVLIAAFPALAVGSYFQMQAMGGVIRKDNDEGYTSAGALFSEAVINMRTVNAFNMEQYVKSQYLTFISENKVKELRGGFAGGAGFGISQFLMYGIQALLFYVGGIFVTDGTITFESFFAVLMSVMLSSFGVGMASQVITDAPKAKAAASNVFSVVDRTPLIDANSTIGETLVNVRGDLSFKQVDFVYPTRPEAKIYEKYTLSIESGQTVALVGASGGGKSTAIALLERFYDPLSGVIELDGKPLTDFNLNWLREQFSLVSQEPVLFSGTIEENIKYGKSNATTEEVVEAAKMANAYTFISQFPNGFETQVGDRGIQVSGGQKQRIALARAIIRDPPVLLLDEATSALDSESERIVQESLDRLILKGKKKRTTIVIAHRLSTIRHADKIAVVKDGEIIEEGTHNELMDLKGEYAMLVEGQRVSSNS